MNNGKLIGRVHSAMYHQCQSWDYAAPVDVLMDIGVLSKKKYEDWRTGRTLLIPKESNKERPKRKTNQNKKTLRWWKK